MAPLPFVVEPRLKPVIELIGSEESGKIAVERRGYLTVGEKSFVQQARSVDTGTLELIGLSRKVSRKLGIGLDAAYNVVTGVVSGTSKGKQAAQIEEEFAEDIQHVITALASAQDKESMIMAAALLVSRVDTSFEIQTINTIHPDIMQGLADLYREEESKNLERLQGAKSSESDTSIEELEKKLSPETADS
jgi:hypothetical protein